MAGEVNVNKWHGGILIDIEDREKVMLKFGTDSCSMSAALERAIKESVKSVKKLPKDVQASIRDEIDRNKRKRLERRKLMKSGVKNVSGRKSPRKISVPEK